MRAHELATAVMVLPMMIACGPQVELPAGSSGGATQDDEGGTTTARPATTTTGRPATTTTATTEVDSGVLDEGPRLDLMLDPDVNGTCVAWPFGGCGTPSVRGMVTGTTPLGEFTTTLAVFGSDGGCAGTCEVSANVARIYAMDDLALVEQLAPWSLLDETLVLGIEDWGGFQGPPGEPVMVTLYANRGGVTEQTTAEMVLDALPTAEELSDPFDPGTAVVLTGVVLAQSPGWNLEGTFAASYCPEVNEYAICE